MTAAFKDQFRARLEEVVGLALDAQLTRAKAAVRKAINEATTSFFGELGFLLGAHLDGPPSFLVDYGIGLGWVPLSQRTLDRKIDPPSYFHDTGELSADIVALEEHAASVFGADNARAPASVRFTTTGTNDFRISVTIFPKLSPQASDEEIAQFLQNAGVAKAVTKFMDLGTPKKPFRPILRAFVDEFIAVQVPMFVRRALEQEGFVVK